MKNFSLPKIEIETPKFFSKIDQTKIAYGLILVSVITFIISMVVYIQHEASLLNSSQQKTYNIMKQFFGNSYFDPAYTVLTIPNKTLEIHNKNDDTLCIFQPFETVEIKKDDEYSIDYDINNPFLKFPVSEEKSYVFQYEDSKWTIPGDDS